MPFYKGTVTFSYVSDVPLKNTDLEQIITECDMGGAVGGKHVVTEETIDRAAADELAREYGSDGEFFGEFGEEASG